MPIILEKPCRFVDSHHRKISKCVQQYLDTYALVRSDTSTTGWSMEHIRVASGCACKVDPVKAAAANRRRKKLSSSQRSQHQIRQWQTQHQRPFPDFFLTSRSSNNNNNNDRNNKKRSLFQQFGSRTVTD